MKIHVFENGLHENYNNILSRVAFLSQMVCFYNHGLGIVHIFHQKQSATTATTATTSGYVSGGSSNVIVG